LNRNFHIALKYQPGQDGEQYLIGRAIGQ